MMCRLHCGNYRSRTPERFLSQSGVEWVFGSFQVLFCLYKLQGSCFGKISKTWNSIMFGILLENPFIYSAFSGLSEKWWFSVFAGVFLVSGLQQVPQQQQSKPHMSHPMSPQPVSRPAWWLVLPERCWRSSHHGGKHPEIWQQHLLKIWEIGKSNIIIEIPSSSSSSSSSSASCCQYD